MDQFERELTGALRALRAYALKLSGTRSDADDLVQDTCVRALVGRATYTPGTNMKSWLFTIMRHASGAALRRGGVECVDLDAAAEVAAAQDIDGLALDDANRLLDVLPTEQREAVLLLAVSSLAVEDVARQLGVEKGTVKSRVHRARAKMAAAEEHGGMPARGVCPDHIGRHVAVRPPGAAQDEAARNGCASSRRRKPMLSEAFGYSPGKAARTALQAA